MSWFDDDWILRRGDRPPVSGGVGIETFDTIGDLITASEGGLAPGYYGATTPAAHPDGPTLLTYWDGAAFAPRSLSRIEDLWDDIVLWHTGASGMYTEAYGVDLADPTDPVRMWRSRLDARLLTHTGGNVLRSSALGGCTVYDSTEVLVSTQTADITITAACEIFSTVQAADLVDSNSGIMGTWNGAAGWVLVLQNSAAPFGVAFGWDGTFAIDTAVGARIDTNPHIVHGRYNGTLAVVSVDGVDKASVTAASVPSAAGAQLAIGGYHAGNALTYMSGNIGEVLKINRELTPAERAMVVADMAARAGITLP